MCSSVMATEFQPRCDWLQSLCCLSMLYPLQCAFTSTTVLGVSEAWLEHQLPLKLFWGPAPQNFLLTQNCYVSRHFPLASLPLGPMPSH